MVESKTPRLFLMPRTQSNPSHRYSPMRQSVWHPSRLSHTSRHRSSSLKNVMNLWSMSWDSKTVRRCKQLQMVKVEADKRNFPRSPRRKWTKMRTFFFGLLTWVVSAVATGFKRIRRRWKLTEKTFYFLIPEDMGKRGMAGGGGGIPRAHLPQGSPCWDESREPAQTRCGWGTAAADCLKTGRQSQVYTDRAPHSDRFACDPDPG